MRTRWIATIAGVLAVTLGTPAALAAGPPSARANAPHLATASAATSDVESFAEPVPNCTIAKQCFDQFGTAVSLDAAGDLAAVGAWKWDPAYPLAGPGQTGVVWVYSDTATGWSESAELASPATEGLGVAVAMSGDGHTIVAAALESAGPWEYLNSCLTVQLFVYTEPAGGWSGTLAPTTELSTPSGPSNSCPDNGYSPVWMNSLDDILNNGVWLGISDDGETVVSSVNGDSLYEEPSGGWGAEDDVPVTVDLTGETTTPDGSYALQAAGNAPVAISGDGSTVAAGQGFSLDTPYGGVVNTYDQPPRGWSSTASLPPTDELANPTPNDDPLAPAELNGSTFVRAGRFGLDAIALSDDGAVLAVSDIVKCATDTTTTPYCNYWDYPEDGPNPLTGVGGANVFQRTSTGWTAIGDLVSSDATYDDWAGIYLAISADGTQVLLGVPSRTLPGDVGYGSGAALLYAEGAADTWSESSIISPSAQNQPGDLGFGVALPGDGARAFVADVYLGTREGSANDYVPIRSPDTLRPTLTRGRRLMRSLTRTTQRSVVYAIERSLLPTVTSVTPRVVPEGGTVVVRGRNLTGVHFRFDGAANVPIAEGPGFARLRIPLRAYTSTLIASHAKTALGGGVAIRVLPPHLDPLRPLSVKEGMRVTVRGSDLGSIFQTWLSGVSVKVRVLSHSTTAITFVVPAGRGTGEFYFTTPTQIVVGPRYTYR